MARRETDERGNHRDGTAPGGTRPGSTGIGGWLILPLLGFAGTMVLTAYNVFQTDVAAHPG